MWDASMVYHAPPLPHPVQAMLDIVVISTSLKGVQHAEPGSMTGHLHLLYCWSQNH